MRLLLGSSLLFLLVAVAAEPAAAQSEPTSMLAIRPFFAWWFNPRTGGWHANGTESTNCRFFANDIASGPGVGDQEFDPPGDAGPGQDWVLVLSASEGL